MNRWHEAISDKLKLIGFIPSEAEPDLYMQYSVDQYQYIAVYS